MTTGPDDHQGALEIDRSTSLWRDRPSAEVRAELRALGCSDLVAAGWLRDWNRDGDAARQAALAIDLWWAHGGRGGRGARDAPTALAG